MDIKNLNKAEVLAALYNNAEPQGMGILHYDPKPMSIEEAQRLLTQGRPYFDYYKGRPLKIDLSTDDLDTRSYNAHNTESVDTAEGVLEKLIKLHKAK